MGTSKKSESNRHPGSDKRYQAIDLALKRLEYEKDALLEVLNIAQETFGYLSEELLTYVANQLQVPMSQAYGVASFYHMLYAEPVGRRIVRICADPACAIAGAEDVLATACQHAGEIRPGETSADGTLTIERVTCLGLCDQAPGVLEGEQAFGRVSEADIPALFDGAAAPSVLQVTGEPRVLTRHIGLLPPTDLDAHRADGAFAALEKALTSMTPDQVIEEIKTSNLVGRGGAGFPTGSKLQFTRAAPGEPKYVVCNADESEPGTFKDRAMMEGDPFRVLEGMILCGYAIGSSQGYVFIRGEYPQAARIIQEAIDKLRTAGLLGQNILDTGFDFDVEIRRGAGAYICGEETALFEAVKGKRGFPRLKPPFPTTHGLFDKPTAINNVETLSAIPDIVLNGGEWLRQWGTEKSAGVKLFCVSGHVKQTGVVELPFGTSLRHLIEQHCGGFEGTPQAILMGGAAGGFLTPDQLDTPLTFEDLWEIKAPLGSGVVMAFNDTVDMRQVLRTLARFFEHESCGQCLPCRVGTVQIYKILDRLSRGEGKPGDLDRLEELCHVVKTTSLCGLGQSAPNPVLSALSYFHHEYEASIKADASGEAAAD